MYMSVHLISWIFKSIDSACNLYCGNLSHVYGQLQVHVQPGQGPEAIMYNMHNNVQMPDRCILLTLSALIMMRNI